MAKSLRSKWKRKMNAIKRVRYGVKELAKLNLILDTAKDVAEASTSDNEQNVVKLVSRWRPSRLAKKERLLAPRSKPKNKPDEEAMETNDEVEVKAANLPKYPVWLGSHRRKKLVYRNKAINKKKKKEMKKTVKKRK